MPLLGLMFGSKIGTIITLVILGSGLFFGWLTWHDSEVWNKATEAFNKAQEELVAKKEEEFKQQTVVIDDNAQRIRDAIAERERELDNFERRMETTKVITTESGTTTTNDGNNQVSPYLKEVVKELDSTYGVK